MSNLISVIYIRSFIFGVVRKKPGVEENSKCRHGNPVVPHAIAMPQKVLCIAL